MTQSFGTNSNNDLYIGTDGNIVVLANLDAVIAACANAAKAQLGEMVLQQNDGIPNFQAVWVGKPNYAIFSSYLRTQLQAVEGVIEVTNIEITATNNVLAYTATIKTIYGEGNVNG